MISAITGGGYGTWEDAGIKIHGNEYGVVHHNLFRNNFTKEMWNYFGNAISAVSPIAGPFQNLKQDVNTFKVWPLVLDKHSYPEEPCSDLLNSDKIRTRKIRFTSKNLRYPCNNFPDNPG